MRISTKAAFAAALLAFLAACADSAPLSAPIAGEAAVTSRAPEEVMEGEFVVRFADDADATAAAEDNGMQIAQALGRATFVLRGEVGAERARARLLLRDRRVVYAEPNYLRQPTTIHTNLWAFQNRGDLNMKFTKGRSKGQPLPAQYAPTLDADQDNIEGYAAGGADVVIGSIDSGVDFTHPEFAGRLIAGRDWYRNDNDPTDDDGHGTHTTGTMAGSTVGVAGVAGAAPHVKVYVQKVCGKRGCPTSAIVSAIRAAADVPNMVAINLSLGGTSESQAEKDAIAYATSKGVLVIAASGNDGVGTISCPACDPLAISVAATTWSDALAPYSNYGTGLDISAPGGNCFSNSTPEGCIYSAAPGGGYAWMQGTSMAAPQVTGTAAIVASVTGLRGEALRQRLLLTVDAKGDENRFGKGRLNSYRAVTGNTLAAGQ